MTKSKRSVFKGFTLIELMVVVTIIAILAALIVPALQRAQSKAMAMKCLSGARSIAATIRTYASNNDGWTNPDAQHYIKDFGYRLSDETGYDGDAACTWASDSTKASYQTALRIRDFCCPVDEAPTPSAHAVPTSYRVTSAFAGRNIMNMTGEANRTLLLRETGTKSHPLGNNVLESTYVFADMSTTLGYNGPVLRGLRMRAWNQANSSGIMNVAESALPAAPFETEHSGQLYYDNNWASMLKGNGVTSWDAPTIQAWNWNGPWLRYLGAVCVRFDGFLRFPADGTWAFNATCHHGHTQRGIGVGTPDGNPTSLLDCTQFAWTTYTGDAWHSDWGVAQFARLAIDVPDANVYYPFQYILVGRNSWGGCAGWFNALWRRSPDGGATWDTTYGGTAGQNIPGSAFSIMP